MRLAKKVRVTILVLVSVCVVISGSFRLYVITSRSAIQVSQLQDVCAAKAIVQKLLADILPTFSADLVMSNSSTCFRDYASLQDVEQAFSIWQTTAGDFQRLHSLKLNSPMLAHLIAYLTTEIAFVAEVVYEHVTLEVQFIIVLEDNIWKIQYLDMNTKT